MADGAIAMGAWQREHLRRLRIEAQGIAERMTGRALYTPDDDALVERIYGSLRVQAYQREMEPFIRIAARSLQCKVRTIVVDQHGHIVPPEGDTLDPEVRKWLDDAGAMVRRHYELEAA